MAGNTLLYANCTALSFIELVLLPIEVLQCGNKEFRVFFRKIVENIKICRSYWTIDADDADTHFLAHYRQFQRVYATVELRCQGAILRRIGGRGHFRSRDKDGGNTISSAIVDNPLLYANFTILYRSGVIAD